MTDVWQPEPGELVRIKSLGVDEAVRRFQTALHPGLVLEIDPMRYGGAAFPKQRPGAYVLWTDGVRVWEPCTYLEPASE